MTLREDCLALLAILLVALTYAVQAFLGALVFWIPGAILMDIGGDPNTAMYRVGFALVMVGAGFAVLGCLIGCCSGTATICEALEEEREKPREPLSTEV